MQSLRQASCFRSRVIHDDSVRAMCCIPEAWQRSCGCAAGCTCGKQAWHAHDVSAGKSLKAPCPSPFICKEVLIQEAWLCPDMAAIATQAIEAAMALHFMTSIMTTRCCRLPYPLEHGSTHHTLHHHIHAWRPLEAPSLAWRYAHSSHQQGLATHVPLHCGSSCRAP